MLITASVKRSAEYYRDKLGFEIDFIYEGRIPHQPNYAVVRRDGLEVHFESYEHDEIVEQEPRVKCGVYFMVDDVDALHEEFVQREGPVGRAPMDQSYGIRDFKVLDLDGYQLLFGSRISWSMTSMRFMRSSCREKAPSGGHQRIRVTAFGISRSLTSTDTNCCLEAGLSGLRHVMVLR